MAEEPNDERSWTMERAGAPWENAYVEDISHCAWRFYEVCRDNLRIHGVDECPANALHFPLATMAEMVWQRAMDLQKHLYYSYAFKRPPRDERAHVYHCVATDVLSPELRGALERLFKTFDRLMRRWQWDHWNDEDSDPGRRKPKRKPIITTDSLESLLWAAVVLVKNTSAWDHGYDRVWAEDAYHEPERVERHGFVRRTSPQYRKPYKRPTFTSAADTAARSQSETPPQSVPAVKPDPEWLAKIRSPAAIELIRYMLGRPSNKAELKEIARDVLRAAVAIDTARQRYYRAKELLEKTGAPFRLFLIDKTVQLRSFQ